MNLLKEQARYEDAYTEAERRTLRDTEVTQKYMRRLALIELRVGREVLLDPRLRPLKGDAQSYSRLKPTFPKKV